LAKLVEDNAQEKGLTHWSKESGCRFLIIKEKKGEEEKKKDHPLVRPRRFGEKRRLLSFSEEIPFGQEREIEKGKGSEEFGAERERTSGKERRKNILFTKKKSHLIKRVEWRKYPP